MSSESPGIPGSHAVYQKTYVELKQNLSVKKSSPYVALAIIELSTY